jgi:hypothetical protein
MIFGVSTVTGPEALTGSATLTGSLWDRLISSGIHFASEVCRNPGNHISFEFADQLNIEPFYRNSS